MSIPYVAGAFRGWTKRRLVRLVTKTPVNHIMTQTALIATFDIMIQPLQPERVNRKPEEQRAWKWYDIITKSANPAMKIDDILQEGAINYRIDSVQPWTEAGYRRYEATEDYTGLSSLFGILYLPNGATAGSPPANMAYQEGTDVIIADNTMTRNGYIFDGWGITP